MLGWFADLFLVLLEFCLANPNQCGAYNADECFKGFILHSSNVKIVFNFA